MAIFIRNQLKKYILQQKSATDVFSKKDYATEATFKTSEYKLHMLDKGPSQESTITKDLAVKLYKEMSTIRLIENLSANMYREKLIRGFLHLYSGEEAVAVGIKSLLRPDDLVITAYRCHGWAYLFSFSEVRVLGELAGRVTGQCKGKGGSMHLYDVNFYGGNGIVGAQVPVGTGIALAVKLRKEKRVCVTLYGDGAANQGQVFESFNIAKLKMLPCMYVCENNLYGMGTSDKRSSANPKYYTRCEYIPGIRADGMDVMSMREVTKYALDHIEKGKGPIIIEAVTYRYMGHSMSDPGTSYRSREEVKKVREERDPIKLFKEKIIGAQLVTKEEIKEIDKGVKANVAKAKDTVLASKHPGPEDLGAEVYVKPLTKTCRNVNIWNPATLSTAGKHFNK